MKCQITMLPDVKVLIISIEADATLDTVAC